jgi:lysophospholipase L1-like esterase
MASSSETVYLFAGDSLTEGTYGENYVSRVTKALHQGQYGLEGEVVNAGRGGDTVRSLLSRFDRSLHRHLPDWVILAVGSNDAWFPWLASRSVGWRLALAYRAIKSGQKPTTDLDQFAAAYRALIDKAQRLEARVLVCTATPIGEKLGSPVNRQLARLNGVIKHVAADCEVPVADVWQVFVEELAALSRPSGHIPGEWLFTWMDRRRLRTASPDELSQRRRMHLTFDGIHLNSRGADLWADTVLNALAQAQGVTGTLPGGLARELDLFCFEQEPLQICCTPGWQPRARDLSRLLAAAYRTLASLAGTHPEVHLAVLSRVHWGQAAPSLPYPQPAARWDGKSGTVLVPSAYDEPFLRRVHLPETVAVWTSWPPSLAEVGEPARATALADLLAVQELASLFLNDLRVVTTNLSLDDLFAAYLAQVAIHALKGEGAAQMAALWDA